jgi:uncharacterized RDD family membrane protein YckC
MSCPRCGDNCHCSSSENRRPTPRFVPSFAGLPSNADGKKAGAEVLPETSNQAEQPGHEIGPTSSPRARFVVRAPSVDILPEVAETSEQATTISASTALTGSNEETSSRSETPESGLPGDLANGSAPVEPIAQTPLPENAPEWRKELANRLQTYHSRRRRRPPRYPSLNLKFESPQRAVPARNTESVHASGAYAVMPTVEAVATATLSDTVPVAEPEPEFAPAEFSNVIEFPRPLIPPPPPPDQLAEPILDKPRILEAPETVPKQVPLGGIVLEPQEAPVSPSLELPLQVAPLSARIMAAAIDAVVVLVASAMFAVIVSQLSPIKLPQHPLPVLLLLLPAGLWVIYQYLLLTFAASTPGLHLARLQLNRFEGGTPSRRLRRWRAVAMALSGVSLGLGFLWSFLDEDTLCWHDRITHTYLTSAGVRRPTWMTHAAERVAKLHSEIRDAITGALPQ